MPNLIGSLKKDGTLTGILSSPFTITGYLSNVTLRGIPIELRVNDDEVMQWKYLDDTEWKDLINFHNIDFRIVDYATLLNLPQINGVELSGNKTFEDLGLTALTAAEVETILT